MVLMMMTNDFLAMSLTTDRASRGTLPSCWRMRSITAAAVVLSACKLGFSTNVVVFGRDWLGLGQKQLQTLAFVTLVLGAQAVLYVVRERRPMWSSKPSKWVLVASAADIAIVSVLALSGTLMAPLPWAILAAVAAAGSRIRSSVIPGLSVDGNSKLLRRAADNVLRNAIRFAPVGTDVEVSTPVVDGSGATILVRDHGPGVPDHELERIFEAFYRAAEEGECGSGGAGLGLAITARIMALHRGYAKARNASDGGLIIELCFPKPAMSRERTDNRVDAAFG